MTCSSPACAVPELEGVMPGLAADSGRPARTSNSESSGKTQSFTSVFGESLDRLAPEDDAPQEEPAEDEKREPLVFALAAPLASSAPAPLVLDFDLSRADISLGEVVTLDNGVPQGLEDMTAKGHTRKAADVDADAVEGATAQQPDRNTAFTARLMPLQTLVSSPSNEGRIQSPADKLPATFLPKPVPAISTAMADGANQNSAELKKDDSGAGSAEPRASQPQAASLPSFTVAQAASQAAPASASDTTAGIQPVEIRRVDMEVHPEPATTIQPAREINIRIGHEGEAGAHVRLLDRAGDIFVSVRSSETQLTQSLRTEINDLAQRLHSAGFRADISLPTGGAIASQRTSTDPGTANEQQPGSDQSGPQWRGGRNRQHSRQNRGGEWSEEWNES